MGFALGKNSLARLSTVDPRLQAVVKRALQISPVDFSVVQGNRTRDEQARLYGKGRTAGQMSNKGLPTSYARPSEDKVTWTMNSNHIGGKAVDLAPFVRGAINWDENGKLGLWPKIAKAMRDAASELGVGIRWGGDWQGTPDRPHFELTE